MDELRTKHRKEQKELQSRITQKKKNATKKTRKGVNDECDRLERELAEQQRAEIDTVDASLIEDELDRLSIEDKDVSIADDKQEGEPETVKQVRFNPSDLKTTALAREEEPKSRKPNRQKARMARRAAEQEAQIVAAEEEAANQPDLREQEMTSMKAQMDKLGLKETFIRPDGHCLYSACALRLPADKPQTPGSTIRNYQSVRSATADFITQHPDDFSAFLEEPLDVYVKKIRDTAEWGGHLELQAISRSYKININVLRSDGRVEKFSPVENDKTDNEIWLAYYRHSFGLGEHYNSLYKSNT